MSTLEYVNENYDKSILLFIFTATIAVIILILLLMAFGPVGARWLLLPGAWWVGGMMVWAQGKYMRTKANKN